MTDRDESESPAARRHRWARSIRALGNADAAAQLLEAYEVLTAPTVTPSLLDSVESLPDWDYRTLLQWAIDRVPTPTYGTSTLRAKDLLDGRQRQLAGWLSEAAEQAWALGDLATCGALAQLSNHALIQAVGGPALTVALGGNDEPGDA